MVSLENNSVYYLPELRRVIGIDGVDVQNPNYVSGFYIALDKQGKVADVGNLRERYTYKQLINLLKFSAMQQLPEASYDIYKDCWRDDGVDTGSLRELCAELGSLPDKRKRELELLMFRHREETKTWTAELKTKIEQSIKPWISGAGKSQLD